MKLKVPELIAAHQTLGELLEQPANACWALWCARTLRTLDGEARSLADTARRLSDDPTGLDALNAETIEVDVRPFPPDRPDGGRLSLYEALAGLLLSPLQALRLGPLLEESYHGSAERQRTQSDTEP